MQLASMLATAILSTSAMAQITNVLPTNANGVAGSASSDLPWGTNGATFPGVRVMCVYDSTHFTTGPIPITVPILITRVKWRADDAFVIATWTGGTYSQATLSLATAAVDHAAATTTFASNVGPDYTQVYSGPVTVQGGSGAGAGVLGPHVVDIPVNPPFLYDPSAGDLVVDTAWAAGAWGGGTHVRMDVDAVNPLARRIFATTTYPFASGVDSIVPVIEVSVVAAGTSEFATNTPLGQGCIREAASVYEHFTTPAAFDLANHALTFLPIGGGGYVAELSGSLKDVGSTAAPETLALFNDSQVVRAFTVGTFPPWGGLVICSNGIISRGSGNTTGGAPTAAAMLNAPQTAFWSWHDFNPTIPGSGSIVYEESASRIVVTWNGVWDQGGTSAANANRVQFQFYPTGRVTIAWGAMSGLGNSHLVGYSPSGPNLDHGSFDLSAIAPVRIATGDVLPLTLAATTRPVVNTSWGLVVSNIPATGVFGFDIFGSADPGITDLGFLGMPGCGLRASLEWLGAFPVLGTTHAYALSIPNVPSLVNAHVFTTSAVFQVPPGNAFGAVLSNGIDGRIGDM